MWLYLFSLALGQWVRYQSASQERGFQCRVNYRSTLFPASCLSVCILPSSVERLDPWESDGCPNVCDISSGSGVKEIGWSKSVLGVGTLPKCSTADCTAIYFLSAYHTPPWYGEWKLFFLGLVALEFIASLLGKRWITGCYLDPSARENLFMFHGRHASNALVFLLGMHVELRVLNQSILHVFKTGTGYFVSCHLRNDKADLGPRVPH